jgi:mRNA-degrading endonuclease toxin of MazEF toxin-antitoxin module
VKRGELWLAEVTTSIRGLDAEVDVDHVETGLDRPSVINSAAERVADRRADRAVVVADTLAPL